jgi:hypothetical protein
MEQMGSFEKGDVVRHTPSNEEWVVLRAGTDGAGGFVEPAGWPPCRARSADCVLVKKGSGSHLFTHPTNTGERQMSESALMCCCLA